MQPRNIAELTLQKQTLQGKLLSQQKDFCHSLLSSVKGSLLVHGRRLKDVGAVSNLGCQTTMVVDQLGIDSIMLQAALLLPLNVVIPGVLGEAPAQPCDNVYLKMPGLHCMVQTVQSSPNFVLAFVRMLLGAIGGDKVTCNVIYWMLNSLTWLKCISVNTHEAAT